MLSEDKYSKHPRSQICNNNLQTDYFKRTQTITSMVHKHVLTEIAQMATAIF